MVGNLIECSTILFVSFQLGIIRWDFWEIATFPPHQQQKPFGFPSKWIKLYWKTFFVCYYYLFRITFEWNTKIASKSIINFYCIIFNQFFVWKKEYWKWLEVNFPSIPIIQKFYFVGDRNDCVGNGKKLNLLNNWNWDFFVKMLEAI